MALQPNHASRPPGLVRHFERACAQTTASPRFALTLLGLVLAWEVAVLFLKASQKLFWYDELITLHISSLQPFSLLWRALQAGADAIPPGYYVFVRLARVFPIDPHVALRAPSVLGYILTLLGVYWFIRKTLPVSAGLVAVILITLSPFREFAFEARPYALMTGFFAVSAALWQRIGEKRFATPAFALFLALAVSCHHLAVIAISCFCLAELTWTLASRRIRWEVWAAFLFAACPFFLGLPLLMHFRAVFAKNFWSRPDWATALATYQDYLGLSVKLSCFLVFFLALGLAGSLRRMFSSRAENTSKPDFTPPEIVLVGGFLLYPALLVTLAMLLHSTYVPRYGWPAIFGLSVGLVYLLRYWLERSAAPFVWALLLAFAVQGGDDLVRQYKAGPLRVGERWTRLVKLSREHPGLPIVIASGGDYLEAAQYAPPEVHDRLVQVADAEIAVRMLGTDSIEKINRLLARFVDLRLEDPASFQALHPRFLLHSDGNGDWITRYLLEAKYRLTLLSREGGRSLYFAER